MTINEMKQSYKQSYTDNVELSIFNCGHEYCQPRKGCNREYVGSFFAIFLCKKRTKEIPNAQKNVLSAQCCRQDVFSYSAYTRMPTKIIASAASFLGFIFSWKIVTPKIVT